MHERLCTAVRPSATENIRAVLLEARSVKLPEVAVLAVVRGGFTDVVETRPYKLSGAVFGVAVAEYAPLPVFRRPNRGAVAEGGALPVVVAEVSLFERKVVYPAAGHYRGCLAAVDAAVGVFRMVSFVELFCVVVARDFQYICAFLPVLGAHLV